MLEEKPKVKFVKLAKEGRGANCSVTREMHEVIYGIHVEGYLLETEKPLIETKESKGEWVSMTDKNCDIWSEEQRDWINIPIFKIAHKVNDSLDRFTDYRVTFDSSKGIAISRFEVFPYEEETVKQPSYMLIREYKEQLLPGNMNTADRWKYSHAHNLWFRETTSKDLDQFIENLLSEEFERSRETSEHELYKDPIQFSKAIGELLRDISIYNRMKYNPYDRLNLERLFW